MASVLIQTADAVVDELNDPTGHTWSQQFTAERTYADWDLPLESEEERGILLCHVVPVSGLGSELETRGSVAYAPAVDIVLRKKFEPADLKADDGKLSLPVVDELVALVEEINEHFAAEELPEFGDAVWKETKILAAVNHKHLRQFNQFTGIVRLTFDVSKAL